MLKATWKSIVGRKGRILATAVGVMLGISFLVGTQIFTDSVGQAFDDLFSDVYENTDAEVRSAESIEVDFVGEVRGNIDESYAALVAGVDGVAEVDPYVGGSAQIVDADGEPIGNPGQGPPTFGFSWNESETINPWVLNEGTRPNGLGEMVVDAGTASNGDLSVGDTVTVITTTGNRDFELVGIARFGSTDSPGGATFAIWDLATAQEVLGFEGEYTGISVVAEDGVSQTEIVSRIEAALDPSVEAVTGEELTEENQNSIADGLSFFTIFLTAFAIIALFVSCFVIYNTFSIVIAQRQRELALFRAIGATRRQVVMSVFIEALVVGVVASILGIALGAVLSNLLRAMLDGFGISLPSAGLIIESSTIITALIAGVLVTAASALFPALAASRITPMEALHEAQAEAKAFSGRRLVAGLIVTGIGVAALLFGLLSPNIELVGLGAAATFIGVFVLGPLIVPPLVSLLAKPAAAVSAVTGDLARENAQRSPRRTARTAAALTVGVALVAGVTVLASSLRTTIRDIVGEQFIGDFAVESGSFGFGGLPPELPGELEALDEVEVATGIRLGLGEVDGNGDFFSVVDPSRVFDVIDLGEIDGSTDLGLEQIMVFTDTASDLGVGLGDTVPVTFVDGLDRDLEVIGIYERNELAGNYTIAQSLYEETGAEQFDFVDYIILADGVSIDDARPAIEGLVDAYPNADLQDREAYIDAQAASLDQLVNVIYALLALAVIIAAVGIANTLRLSVLERTREIGLLRAVGMTRGQVRSTVRYEAIITSLIGAVQGVILGLFFGYAIVFALRDEGNISFNVPWLSMIVVLILAVIVGLVASLAPARRAAKMDILAAIATD